MQNFPNCVPQEIHTPDQITETHLEGFICPHCEKEEIFVETDMCDDGFIVKNYWCDSCEKFVSPCRLEDK